MITEAELQKLFEVFDRELERKKKLPEFDPSKVQHWFKPVIVVYFYGGLRKHEATYSPELVYSGLQGENLTYQDGTLAYIDLPATKGRSERRIPIIRSLRRYLNEYLAIRGPVGPKDYLFMYMGGKTKDQPVRGDRVYREFKRYAKVAGIPSMRSLHGMRHQAVTQWIDDGFHTAEASYMAGPCTKTAGACLLLNVLPRDRDIGGPINGWQIPWPSARRQVFDRHQQPSEQSVPVSFRGE